MAVCAELLQLVGRAHAIGVIVAAHAAAVERTAEQLVHRHAERFSADIPQRLVDARYGGADDRTGAIEAVDVHGLPDVLHLHGVGADHEVAEVVHAGDDRAGLPFERAFTPAHQALVGFELDEDVGAVGLGVERNAKDLHAGNAEAGTDAFEGGGSGGRGGQGLECAAAIERGAAHGLGAPGEERSCRALKKLTTAHHATSFPSSDASILRPSPGPPAEPGNRRLPISSAAPARAARKRRSSSASGTGIC